MQTLHALKLLDHVPGNYFQGYSLLSLLKRVEAIRCPEWWDKSSADHHSDHHTAHKCFPVTPASQHFDRIRGYSTTALQIRALSILVRRKMGGLHLADFVSASSESE